MAAALRSRSFSWKDASGRTGTRGRGKSELRWVRVLGNAQASPRLNVGVGTESGTETRPPWYVRLQSARRGKGEKVRQERTSGRVTVRLAKPHSEQGHIGGLWAPSPSPGRLLDPGGNAGTREMATTPAEATPRGNRTRLTGPPGPQCFPRLVASQTDTLSPPCAYSSAAPRAGGPCSAHGRSPWHVSPEVAEARPRPKDAHALRPVHSCLPRVGGNSSRGHQCWARLHCRPSHEWGEHGRTTIRRLSRAEMILLPEPRLSLRSLPQGSSGSGFWQ